MRRLGLLLLAALSNLRAPASYFVNAMRKRRGGLVNRDQALRRYETAKRDFEFELRRFELWCEEERVRLEERKKELKRIK